MLDVLKSSPTVVVLIGRGIMLYSRGAVNYAFGRSGLLLDVRRACAVGAFEPCHAVVWDM